MNQTRQELQNPGIILAKSGCRIRYSLRELEDFYQKKNDFLKAWKLIKELPPSNPNSFWSIASFHGMPFKERRVEPEHTLKVWNGYCQHGNVLFPTWHRLYCFRLEQALQTVLPNGDVALHYWDTTSKESVAEGLPPILTQPTVTIDNEPNIPNPLLNFTLPCQIEGSPDSFYIKPKGYTTVRYPYSGIVNPADAKVIAEKHNSKIHGMSNGDGLLQENVKWYISHGRVPPKEETISVYSEFKNCLNTSDYNAFSNTTSAANDEATVSSSLEQPHNDVHLAIGGYTNPENSQQYYGLLQGSNGDMGANECASFDPIFFLHHCNVDRVFWIWQRKWGKQKKIIIREETPGPSHESGTSPSNQGATPNQTHDQELNMETILYPFQDEYGVPRTSNDCVDIEGQLGYTYSRGSLEDEIKPTPPIATTLYSQAVEKLVDLEFESRRDMLGVSDSPQTTVYDLSKVANEYSLWDKIPLLKPSNGNTFDFGNRKYKRAFVFKVSNLDRDAYPGSFLVLIYEKKGETLNFLGQKSVLDRWDRKSCANCQNHRFAALGFHLAATNPIDPNLIVAKLLHKDPLTGKQNIIELDVKYQPAVVDQLTSDIKPTFQIAIQLDEINN